MSCLLPDNIGEVKINEPTKSITGETLEELFSDTGIGVGITDIISNNVGTAIQSSPILSMV